MRKKINNKKIFIVIILLFLFCSCTSIITRKKYRPYDIIGTLKTEGDSTYIELNKKYGIDISIGILTNKGHIWVEDKNYIKFYDDIRITIKDRKYTIQKEKIKMLQNNFGGVSGYVFEIPKDAIDEKENKIIIEIGVIEKLDSNNNVVKAKLKVPPIILKKYLDIIETTNIISGNILYMGWAEDYQGDIKKLK